MCTYNDGTLLLCLNESQVLKYFAFKGEQEHLTHIKTLFQITYLTMAQRPLEDTTFIDN